VERDPTVLAPGTRFGRYRIESLLGAGAMGAVYVATHIGLDKRVVVKVLHPEHARSSSIRMRFFREGRAAAAIRHPHVVDVTDVGEHEGVGYLVMEHLDGETLGALLERNGALPADRAADLLLPIVAAVDAAHAVGVIHRDLKPENLFVARAATGEPLPKVLDFGISRVVHDTGRRTGTAALLGTPAYMAPEQIESTRDADAKSDQYALGVILYECVTGRPAFPGDNVYTILKHVGDGAFERPSNAPVVLPPGLEAVILRTMARDPATRFPSLRDLACALLPYASARSRSAWGVVFDPGAAHAEADTPLDTQGSPQRPTGVTGDTLADAAQIRDTVPVERRRRSRVYLLALGATALVALVTLAALRHGAPRAAVAPRVEASAPAAPPTPPPAAQRVTAPAVSAAITVAALPAPSRAADAHVLPLPSARRAPRLRRPVVRSPQVIVPEFAP